MLENWTFFKLKIIITTESDSRMNSFANFLPTKHDTLALGVVKLQVLKVPKNSVLRLEPLKNKNVKIYTGWKW